MTILSDWPGVAYSSSRFRQWRWGLACSFIALGTYDTECDMLSQQQQSKTTFPWSLLSFYFHLAFLQDLVIFKICRLRKCIILAQSRVSFVTNIILQTCNTFIIKTENIDFRSPEVVSAMDLRESDFLTRSPTVFVWTLSHASLSLVCGRQGTA